MTRTLTSIIGILLLILLVKFAPAIVCVLVILAAMVLALSEYFGLTQNKNGFSFGWIGYLMASAIVLSFYFTQQNIQFFFPLGAALVLIAALFSRRDMTKALQSTAFTLFGAWYLGGLMGFLVGVRMIDSGGETGSDLLMMLLIIIWSNDIFAFLVGRSIGRHKLAPVVSPRKTVEGAVAGLLSGVGAAVVCRSLFVQQLNLSHTIIMGALVGLAGQLGDLCESLLKRSAKFKDSGKILPGHGGMLDRIDSLLFGAPAVYYYFYFILNK